MEESGEIAVKFAEWIWDENYVSKSALHPIFYQIGYQAHFTLDELFDKFMKEKHVKS